MDADHGEEVHDRVRAPAHASHHLAEADFQKLAAVGEWAWLVDGARLTEQGCVGEDRHLHFLMHGTCEVAIGDKPIVELGPGDIAGEVGVLLDEMANADRMDPEHTPSGSSATVIAKGSVRCFSVPVHEVQRPLSEDPRIHAPLKSLFADALVSKVLAMHIQAKR